MTASVDTGAPLEYRDGRITVHPDICNGHPTIRGMRITVETVLGSLSAGDSPEEIPYVGRKFPTRVWWGEQHPHTSWSGDAGGAGTRVGPEEALRMAKGEEITSNTGQQVKLRRPLD